MPFDRVSPRRKAVGGKTNVVFGIYLSFLDLRNYTDSLKEIGFRTNDISVLFPEGALSKKTSSHDNTDDLLEGRKSDSETLIAGSLGWLTCIGPPAAGELADALIDLGFPAYAAERYEDRIRGGGILTAVRCPQPAMTESVCEILARTGAVGILVTGEKKTATLSRPVGDETSPLRFESRSFVLEQPPEARWATGMG
jgi:hypothetical protein